MSASTVHRDLLALALGAVALTLGCADGTVKPDPERLAALRSEYVLEVEPADAMTPLDWRDTQEEEPGVVEGVVNLLDTVEVAVETSADGSTEVDVAVDPPAEPNRIVLKGLVGGMPNPWGADVEPDFPWKKGQATFFLVDPPTADEFSSHAEEQGDDHAADCPFCAREAANKANAVAAVTFRDAAGEPLPIDARDLFGVAQGDLVVVRGVWSLAGDLLMVDADGLYRAE